ncbi:MAG: hypothetical protein JSV79_12850 [Armatimonadota bacterium]|nr:MAG: hypothetical protein JSV79_12850 [Armatimonadota bacterium]
MHCVPWLPALLVTLLGLCFAETRVDGGGSPRYAQPGDISCTLTLFTSDGTITGGEPVIARLEIRNESSEEIRMWPGGTFLDVYDAKGELVAAMPRPRNMLDFMHSTRDLAPGETYSKLLIVSGLYQFESPGLYSVRVQQQGLPQEMPVLCEDAASLQVLPYNAARLEAVCEEIFAPIRKHAAFGVIPTSVRAKAILSVRDDVVLPYLDWMAREAADRYACRAMRRIATARAEDLLAALATRTDRVGEAARQSLDMSLEPTDWDVEGE